MIDACRKEIVALHEFFVDWYKGDLAETGFLRFSQVMADDFQMITPDGTLIRREFLMSALRDAYGSRRDRNFSIQIRNIQVRPVGEDLFLATYEEWQHDGVGERGRCSTVLFRSVAQTPNGLAWVHVHETWLP